MINIKTLFLFSTTFCLFSCSPPVIVGGYKSGELRASNDFKFRTKVYPKNEGYQPAAELKNKTAFLYDGYPAEDWGGKPTITQKYKNDWISGYTDYCLSQGFKVVIVSTEAPPYGN